MCTFQPRLRATEWVHPARVIVVDPENADTFERKAPVLFALGETVDAEFFHVQASGAEFLARLRHQFSDSFVRQVLHAGAAEYINQTGIPADPVWLEPPALTNASLWRLRRDLEGLKPNQPARRKLPYEEPLLGMTILQLRAAGAICDDIFWCLNGQRVRVLRASNTPLHVVEAQFQREFAPHVAPDIVIAVGAEESTQLPNIVRGRSAATITRGNSSRWLTRPDAVNELNL
jgi:hypothetical protein